MNHLGNCIARSICNVNLYIFMRDRWLPWTFQDMVLTLTKDGRFIAWYGVRLLSLLTEKQTDGSFSEVKGRRFCVIICKHLPHHQRNGKAEIIQIKMVLCVKHGCTSELRSIWLLEQEGFGHRMFSDCLGFLPSTVLPLMTLRFLGHKVAEMGSKLVAMATEKCQ